MREDFDKFNLEQDLQNLKADIDQVGADIAHLIRKSTVGRVEFKITKKPLACVLWAFGTGLACCTLLKLFRSRRKKS
jgi:hypothetical protein